MTSEVCSPKILDGASNFKSGSTSMKGTHRKVVTRKVVKKKGSEAGLTDNEG
jgi:hypothetical protein